ncbi:hypothetical protein GQX74_004498 [Glossina fuscipes]|nr:hypothetical protein GQX74_004498 [Glossina fuscipes]
MKYSQSQSFKDFIFNAQNCIKRGKARHVYRSWGRMRLRLSNLTLIYVKLLFWIDFYRNYSSSELTFIAKMSSLLRKNVHTQETVQGTKSYYVQKMKLYLKL